MQRRERIVGRNESEETDEQQWWLAVGWQKWVAVGQNLHCQVLAHQRPPLLGVGFGV